MTNIAVFASGTGTNFDAILQNINNGTLNCKIKIVVCDKPNAKVVAKAINAGIEVFAFNPKDYESKQVYETVIVDKLNALDVKWIVLAGYMRLVSDVLLDAFPNRIVNIHPSLLPAFKGKDAIGQAINYGVKVMGVTIHYVNKEMDGGRIIAQEAFNVQPDWSHEVIEAKVHSIEHFLYTRTLKQLLEEEDNEKSHC